MSESLQVALRDSIINQPRAYLGGIPPGEVQKLQSRLPAVAEVRDEVPTALKIMKEPPPTNIKGVVPEDLRLLCLWALQQRVVSLIEGPDKQLRRILESPEGNVMPGAKSYMELQSRSKIVSYFLSPQINRPEDALPHIEAIMGLEEISHPLPNDAFLRNPQSYLLYGSILARTKTRNTAAKAILGKVVTDIHRVNDDSKMIFIQAKLYLSRVLRGMGEVDDAKNHEHYLITWFKKNPRRVPEATLREWFETEDNTDPIFRGLGGTSWLAKRKPTFKSLDRQARQCYNCGARENASMKLMRCARCEYTYYCSRKCQVADYPNHKAGCTERASEIKLAEALKAKSPDDAKCMEDWRHYQNSGFDQLPSYHALGLMHDINRGRTHIVFKRVEYVPQGGKDVLDRFRVVSAAVFPIKGVLREIEGFLNYNKGEGEKVIEEMLEGFNNGPGKGGRAYPLLGLFITDDWRMGSYLSIGAVTPKTLQETKYNPDWRKLMNRKACTVEQLLLRSGVKDAERDYTPSEIRKESYAESQVKVKNSQPSEGQERSPTAESAAAALPKLRGMFK
ncbi:hypothetical protein V5O48_013242 [Marasmius crinis-equi]|uniref:MYND-type domain-containing protein n=1 Tax=Marasmius crinis-equi TaxID=585013 RepID=A0ABR3F0L8_9AGAR